MFRLIRKNNIRTLSSIKCNKCKCKTGEKKCLESKKNIVPWLTKGVIFEYFFCGGFTSFINIKFSNIFKLFDL